MNGTPELDPDLLPQLTQAYRVSQALYVVAALRIPDLLETGARTADELATATRAHADRLRRLMRALAAEGVFTEDDSGRFGQTAFSRQLAGDGRLMTLGWRTLPETYGAFAGLEHAVRTGEVAFDHVHGAPFYSYLDSHPETAQAYDAAMGTTIEGFDDIAAGYDFRGIGVVVDVGGGRGEFLGRLLARHPGMRGVLFDQPAVVEGAPEILERAGVADRVEIVGGDVFTEVPAGGDAYVTCTVLRCFDDEACLRILENIRRAMTGDSRLVAVEQEIPEGIGQRPTAMLDIHTMVVYGGRDRTAAEYGELYGRAGLRLASVTPVSPPFSAFEGRPA